MGTIRRVVLRVAACLVAAATGVSRAQEARGTDASAKGEKSAVATNAVQGVGTDASLLRQPVPRDRPAGAGAASRGVPGASREESSVGSLVSREREPGRGQQRNLEVIMDLLGGRQAPEPPATGGGGSMKAASGLGFGSAPHPVENGTPPDSRAVFKMDPNQRRKSGS